MDALVSVIIGSRSDWQTFKYAADTLRSMSVSHEVRIGSVQRASNRLVKYVKSAEERGIRIIIASASVAEHLPAILGSETNISVLGAPLEPKMPNGKDSLLSMVPTPVGAFAIGRADAVNAALLAATMLASEHDVIRKALVDYRAQQVTPALHLADRSVAV